MDFVKDFTQQQFKTIRVSLVDYFRYFGGTYDEGHRQEPKRLKIASYESLDTLLGLAYTSTGDYAGLWVCNAVTLWASKTHYFIGFTFNEAGDLCGVAWNENEEEFIVNITQKVNQYGQMNGLQRSLSRCTVDGDVVSLPSRADGELANYSDVRQALLNAGAKYKRSTFIFPSSAQPYMDRLLSGESVNIKKEFQFFGTPSHLADMLVELADIQVGHRVLEPSAGQGAIINAITKRIPQKLVEAFELMPENRMVLEQIERCEILGDDFLKGKLHRQFDRIVANPPFNKNQDIDHILEMFLTAKPGGRIVSVASNSWRNGSQKKQVAFREWLDEIGAEIQDIEAGEFKESGTMVSACIVIINK